MSQERLKKIKSEYGKVQLGNITVDMVHVCLALFFSPFPQTRLMLLRKNYKSINVLFVNCEKVLGGMRGMTGLLWETSLLDADEVHHIPHLSIENWQLLDTLCMQTEMFMLCNCN